MNSIKPAVSQNDISQMDQLISGKTVAINGKRITIENVHGIKCMSIIKLAERFFDLSWGAYENRECEDLLSVEIILSEDSLNADLEKAKILFSFKDAG